MREQLPKVALTSKLGTDEQALESKAIGVYINNNSIMLQ